MGERANLNRELSREEFLKFYYLKEELVEFCKKEELSCAGGKVELTNRIAHYLSTGEKMPGNKVKRSNRVDKITRDSLIEEDIICSEKHRAFFKKEISPSFKFSVGFMNWLRANSGKTYQEAIEAHHRILEEKKKGKSKIDKQFEYNTYIRDFFEDNKGKGLEEAIQCWKYKKGLPGHNRYERSDLKL